MKRIETDSLGDIGVENQNLWGAQTQRAIKHFQISNRKFPRSFIYSLVEIKRAAAIVNNNLGLLDNTIKNAIVSACDDILAGKFDNQFPLDIFQSGSGTQTNMNVNEVISNRAIQILNAEIGSKIIHPNDHINLGQSSNDTIPSAIHISSLNAIGSDLIPAIDYLIGELKNKEKEFKNIIKIGRTHLQDAVPLSLGQEFSGYVSQLETSKEHIKNTSNLLRQLAIGGTAVGTGLNSDSKFAKMMCEILTQRFNIEFICNTNKFALIASKDIVLAVSGALRMLAVTLLKIANDIRWMASGPRAGIGELILPVNEPGSSIMPGKVNPTQNEMLIQVIAQVIGNDTTIITSAQMGYFELNTMMPVISSNLFESITILTNGIKSFTKYAITDLKADEQRIKELVNNSLMIVTALTKHPKIGYDQAATIAKKAYTEKKSIRAILIEESLLSETEIESALDLRSMANLDR